MEPLITELDYNYLMGLFGLCAGLFVVWIATKAIL